MSVSARNTTPNLNPKLRHSGRRIVKAEEVISEARQIIYRLAQGHAGDARPHIQNALSILHGLMRDLNDEIPGDLLTSEANRIREELK